MRVIRNTDPSLYFMLTIRTAGAKLWMIPSREVKQLVGGILARYQEIYKIEIYSYFFLSNHFHLLIRAPLGNYSEFCMNLDREVALRMNWRLRRTGQFWAKRFNATMIGEREEDLLDAFLYITTNATRHGLLKDSKDWPGLHSYTHSLNERDREFTFYHYSARDDEPKQTKHLLKLSILPQFESLTKNQRTKELKRLLEEKQKRIDNERKEQGKSGYMSVQTILSQEIGEAPIRVSRKKVAICYTSCIELWKRKKRELKDRLEHYSQASAEYRLGKTSYTFPPFCFMPPLHIIPRLFRFQPLALFQKEIFVNIG